MSPNIMAILGYTPGEVLELGCWRDHQHLEDREKALKAIDEIRAKGHVVHEYRLWSPSVAWPAGWPMISITC
ncbi:MAG: PAS domain-containing protein [Deltaproteobacteria bacterium]|nr:PAS domain-containing protein [Deltaproteobacteria bacterium]